MFLLFCQYFVKFRGLQLTESLPKICHNLVYLLLISFALPIHFCVSCVFYAFLVNFCTVLVCKIFVQFFKMKFSFQNLCFTLVFLCFWFWCFAFFYVVILLFCRHFSLFTLTLCTTNALIRSLLLSLSLSLHFKVSNAQNPKIAHEKENTCLKICRTFLTFI